MSLLFECHSEFPEEWQKIIHIQNSQTGSYVGQFPKFSNLISPKEFNRILTTMIIFASLQNLMSLYVFDDFQINDPKENHDSKQKYLCVRVGTLEP